MKTIWFKKFGWVYLPIHPVGYLVSLAAVACMVPLWICILYKGQSLTDSLYHIFLYATCIAFWWKWVAENTSE